MDVGGWLRSLGLGKYEAAFRDHEIDETVLRSLTHENLKELGITALGHRLKLLDAITALRTHDEALDAATASSAPRAHPEDRAERRHVTVMFSDLVGSTALSARMDPEDLREVISTYQKCVAETVRRSGGFVAKYMGDGVLIYFGYPQAHEDDAERAVRAGLQLIAAVTALKSHVPLQTRVGIATGLVVVGDLIGSGVAQEHGIVGETPNLAARLQALAEPGAVVVAEKTRRQIGTLFELVDLGPQQLKGFGDAQRPWRVLGENQALGRFAALRMSTVPLVGRDEELELLLRRWAQAKVEGERVVVLSGEAGLGKSRLTDALCERIVGEPHGRLQYYCSSHHQDSALYPIVAQLERAAGFVRDDEPGDRVRKLEALLASSSATREEIALIADRRSLRSSRDARAAAQAEDVAGPIGANRASRCRTAGPNDRRGSPVDRSHLVRLAHARCGAPNTASPAVDHRAARSIAAMAGLCTCDDARSIAPRCPQRCGNSR
jgi:class 3 adenylate cyclase